MDQMQTAEFKNDMEKMKSLSAEGYRLRVELDKIERAKKAIDAKYRDHVHKLNVLSSMQEGKYTLREGDTISGLCAIMYGDSSENFLPSTNTISLFLTYHNEVVRLLGLNKKQVRSNRTINDPNRVDAGTTLFIPSKIPGPNDNTSMKHMAQDYVSQMFPEAPTRSLVEDFVDFLETDGDDDEVNRHKKKRGKVSGSDFGDDEDDE